jgi:hypothetical protein
VIKQRFVFSINQPTQIFRVYIYIDRKALYLSRNFSILSKQNKKERERKEDEKTMRLVE